ncbi:Alpha-D-ribose 1-methylphosphonate 5-phosphate C-P lyase [compost metagenome]
MEKWSSCCAQCGAADSYLDEIITDDTGTRLFVCSDTEYCADRQAAQAVKAAAGGAR